MPARSLLPYAEAGNIGKMVSHRDGEGRINLFSLVSYIPDPLGSFIDGLRQELVPSCRLRAHVTVLPPRPISVNIDEAYAQLRSALRDVAPFEVQLRDVEIFGVSSVIYFGIVGGFSKLCRMHEILNVEGLHFQEPYSFHPHVTLAQQITPEQIPAVYELARRRWAEYRGKRAFAVDSVTFVQGTEIGSWIDLAECPIRTPAPTR